MPVLLGCALCCNICYRTLNSTDKNIPFLFWFLAFLELCHLYELNSIFLFSFFFLKIIVVLNYTCFIQEIHSAHLVCCNCQNWKSRSFLNTSFKKFTFCEVFLFFFFFFKELCHLGMPKTRSSEIDCSQYT